MQVYIQKSTSPSPSPSLPLAPSLFFLLSPASPFSLFILFYISSPTQRPAKGEAGYNSWRQISLKSSRARASLWRNLLLKIWGRIWWESKKIENKNRSRFWFCGGLGEGEWREIREKRKKKKNKGGGGRRRERERAGVFFFFFLKK